VREASSVAKQKQFSDPSEVLVMIEECESPFSPEEQAVLSEALSEGSIITVTEYLYPDLIATEAWFPSRVWQEIRPWEKLPFAHIGATKQVGGVISMVETVHQLFVWWGDTLPKYSWTGMVLAKAGVAEYTAPSYARRFYGNPKWDDSEGGGVTWVLPTASLD